MIEDGWGLVTAEGVKDNEIEDRRGGGGAGRIRTRSSFRYREY